MQPKNAVIILLIIIVIVGLFLAYIYFSGNMSIILPSVINKPGTQKFEEPKTKSQLLDDLMEETKQMNPATTTLEERTTAIDSLMEETKQMNPATTTLEERSAAIEALMEQTKKMQAEQQGGSTLQP